MFCLFLWIFFCKVITNACQHVPKRNPQNSDDAHLYFPLLFWEIPLLWRDSLVFCFTCGTIHFFLVPVVLSVVVIAMSVFYLWNNGVYDLIFFFCMIYLQWFKKSTDWCRRKHLLSVLVVSVVCLTIKSFIVKTHILCYSCYPIIKIVSWHKKKCFRNNFTGCAVFFSFVFHFNCSCVIG